MIVNLSTPQNNFFERTDTLKRYYEDIRKYTPLELSDELELIKTYHSTANKFEKERIKNIILCANQRFALGVARRWATNDNLMDLISEANIGMIEALNDFDYTRGVRFITFAVHYIRRSINAYMIKNGSIIRKNNIAKTYHLISQATNKFMQREFRQPTLEELTEMLKNEYGVELKDVNDVATLQLSSIDEDYGSDDEDANMATMIAFNSCSASFNDCEKTTNHDFAKKLVQSVLKKLTKKEQEVVKYLFGIEHSREYEISEIAEKMEYSTERIRQLKISALEKMRKEYSNIISCI
jgi:RNA polymerase primary sigma factor